MISHRNSKHFFPKIFLWKFQIVSLRNPKLPLLPRSLSDPTTPVWNSELLHLPWVTGGFQWWTPRQSASPRGNRWALILCSWVSKRSNWPDHESVRRVRNFSKFAGRPIKNTVQNGALLHRSTIESCPQFRLSATDSDLPSLPSSKLPIPFGQNLHSGPFRQNGYYHPRDAPGCVMSARFGNVWMVSDRCPTALPSADVSLWRRQPRRRVELPHVESLCTNIGWHFSFRQASFLQTVAAENLLLEGSFAFPSSEANSFDIRFRVLFAIKLAVVSPIRGPGDEHAIAIAQCTATPNNRIPTNEQAKQLEKKPEQKTQPFVLLSQVRMISLLLILFVVGFQSMGSFISDGVVQSWCSRPVLTKYGINFSSHGGDKISSILPFEFKIKRCSL